MSHYIRELQAHAAALQRAQTGQAQQAAVAEADAARERLTPLSDRVTNLLTTIPLGVQREGLSLPTLRTMLRGRQGGACASGELGTVLRGLGWKRVRCWRGGDAGGFSALWHPPGSA